MALADCVTKGASVLIDMWLKCSDVAGMVGNGTGCLLIELNSSEELQICKGALESVLLVCLEVFLEYMLLTIEEVIVRWQASWCSSCALPEGLNSGRRHYCCVGLVLIGCFVVCGVVLGFFPPTDCWSVGSVERMPSLRTGWCEAITQGSRRS